MLHWERGFHDGIIWVRHRKDGAYGKILSMANGTVQLAIQTDHISYLCLRKVALQVLPLAKLDKQLAAFT